MRHQRRQAVVVAETDLVGRDRVVLVDHRDDAKVEQSVQGAPGVGIVRAARDVLSGEQHLADGEVVLREREAVCRDESPLTNAGRRRPGGQIARAAASVGQGALVAAYSLAFAKHDLTVGQVLLTAEDVTRRSHYANARRTLDRLLDLGVVPVVNENDTVATHEIRFGDNDRLAALVAHLVHADALILLSDVDALYDGPPSRVTRSRIPLVRGPVDLKDVKIGGSGSGVGSGGMATKVEAAAIATAAGITTILTSTDQAAAADARSRAPDLD